MGEVVRVQNKTELLREIVREPKVLVLFTQPRTCIPCQRFAPHFERAASEEDDVRFVYADLDIVPESVVEYGIASVPTVKLYEHGVFVRDVKAPQGGLALLADIRS